jgi:DNA mismatch repair protein MutL
MPRIQQLPPSVVSKIAAGEVIERPSSVVKEFLENSVDAGSTRIEVDVDQGGVDRIRVVDDGCGIEPDDLPLAFASHATSKLNCAEDLFRIGTLGFRGEALASIGGVAQVTLQSRPHDRPVGAEIRSHGGDLTAVQPWNGAPGTRIEVRHLFFNTPVRRKFLRTTSTEMGHVCENFTRLALAKPGLHLTLRHNGKDVYHIHAGAALRDRVGLFFGAEVRDPLYEIDARAGPLRLHGFIGDPSCERGTAKLQYLFINGRWVRDRSLGHALQEGYRGLLMTGRYAVAFLFLEIPPDQVDVNIHPTKSEVRFRDSQSLYHLVLTAVRERLRKENLTPRLHLPSSLAAPQAAPVAPVPSWMLTAPPPAAPPLPIPAPPPRMADEPEPSDDSSPLAPPPLPSAADIFAHAGGGPKAIQLYDSYLVLETPEGMLVIDQHALHERILFEQFKQRLQAGPLEMQRLLIPEPIDLPPDHAARAIEHREALKGLGLDVAEFGGNTVLLSGYPAMLGHRKPEVVFKAVVDHLVSKDRPPTREHLLNDLLSLMACHAAVRAGDRLNADEMAALIAQRQLANDTHHCPHGRPTTLLFSRHDLDKQFRRT